MARTAQLNVNVEPELRERVWWTSVALGISRADVVIAGLLRYFSELPEDVQTRIDELVRVSNAKKSERGSE
jgi:hypothetical protein